MTPGGWDNRTFPLGDELLVRLPRADAYVDQVTKQRHWLLGLVSILPLPVPAPVAFGQPGATFSRPWSVYRWLVGECVDAGTEPVDLDLLAADLGRFIRVLHDLDASDGPVPGRHDLGRGGATSHPRSGDTAGARVAGGRHRRHACDGDLERRARIDLGGDPVRIHGDMAAGNVLVREGRLSVTIDVGLLAVSDPACDLAIAWTLLDNASRREFMATSGLDNRTWARGRGWALWAVIFKAASEANEVLQDVDLSGWRVLVTGVSTGIGLETVGVLTDRGALVVGTARDVGKAHAALTQVCMDAGSSGGFEIIKLDLASLASVQACADILLERDKRFDVIINNAGVMAAPKGTTADGFETHFGTNHLGHFVLANRIAGLFNPGGRLVVVSSAGHRGADVDLEDCNFERTPYDPLTAYRRSKTATILFAVEFDRRHRAETIRATAVHPGAVLTETTRKLIGAHSAAAASFAWKTVA